LFFLEERFLEQGAMIFGRNNKSGDMCDSFLGEGGGRG
jgi:hypothetical protein